MRTDAEVADILNQLYLENFGGKTNQRFQMRKRDLREIYPIGRIEDGKLEKLNTAAQAVGLYVFDLGMVDDDKMVGIIKTNTVDRWRTVPRKLVKSYL
jgi:hypothetical protein